MKNILLVGLGGFFGSVLRYLIGYYNPLYGSGFPLNTFVINLAGSFLIGVLGGYLARNYNDYLQFLLITGFCGGFTTFSTFSMEGMKLIRENLYGYFALYTLGSLLGGLVLCAVGFWIVRSIAP